MENGKKCNTGEFSHGDCGNQYDGVGGISTDLIGLLLLPFSSLHEPIPQHWIQVGFLKKNIAVSLPECVVGTDRLEESRGCTDHMSLSLYQDNRLCHVDS